MPGDTGALCAQSGAKPYEPCARLGGVCAIPGDSSVRVE
jgi:hypothetical protein